MLWQVLLKANWKQVRCKSAGNVFHISLLIPYSKWNWRTQHKTHLQQCTLYPFLSARVVSYSDYNRKNKIFFFETLLNNKISKYIVTNNLYLLCMCLDLNEDYFFTRKIQCIWVKKKPFKCSLLLFRHIEHCAQCTSLHIWQREKRIGARSTHIYLGNETTPKEKPVEFDVHNFNAILKHIWTFTRAIELNHLLYI